MKPHSPETSALFDGQVGATVCPARFPSRNYLIKDPRYDYEGNWAFCRFDGGQVYGARFGFGRGKVDGTDYGGSITSKSFLMLHLELMLRDGAVLWLGTSRFQAQQVELSRRAMDARLQAGGREIFHITGWPSMRWHFQSDDREAEIDVRLDLQNVTLLPDNYMQHNLFAMWLAIARVRGRVRHGRKWYTVKGTAFYDHPRIVVQRNRVPAFGWYLYTPMQFADGSFLASYYTEDALGRCVRNSSFGVYVNPEGGSTWLPVTQLESLEYDADRKPIRWRQSWSAPGLEIRIASLAKPTRIRKAWGGANVPQTRKDNPNIPLVFDSRATIVCHGNTYTTRGGGLAEHAGRVAWW